MDDQRREAILNRYITPGDPAAFAGRSKLGKLFKLSPDDVNKQLLSYNYAYQKHRSTKKPRFFNPYFSIHPRQEIHCDLLELRDLSRFNDGVNYILVCIDIFSRKVWAEPLKSKNALPVTEAMKKILNQMDPIYPTSCQMDKGREFRNNLFMTLLRERGIRVYDPHSENKAVFAERVIGTLKTLISKYLTERGIQRYIDQLPNLVKTYNTRSHKAFNEKLSPNEAELHDNLQNVRKILQKHRKKTILRGRRMKPKFSVGQFVRLRLIKNKFDRGYGKKFTEEIFKIHRINHRLPIITYTVESTNTGDVLEGDFYAEELQLVRGDIYRVEKVLGEKRINGVPHKLVKWVGFDDRHNSYIKSSDVFDL